MSSATYDSFGIKEYRKRLTSLFHRLSIACILVIYILKSRGFYVNTPLR